MPDRMTPAEHERLRQERAAAAQQEINEMDDVIFGSEAAPALEPAPEPEPISEPEEVLEPETEPESVSTRTEEEVIPEEEEYDFNFIEDMARSAIARMQGQPQEQPQPEPSTPPVQAPTPAPAPVAAPPQAPTMIVSVEEMQEAFDSPEKMVELMGKVYARAKADAVTEAHQRASAATVEVVETAEKIREFYKTNPELKPYNNFVRYCAMQVEKKHPDWDFDRVATETAKLAKRELPRLAQSRVRPALPGSGGGGNRRGSPSPKLTSLEQEIAAMPDNF